jgi:hypothetical protein
MRHPAYHLRPNKAVDRLLLVEAIRRLERLGDISAYTYYGFGGPYLEEFRLLYELFPEMGMISIEENAETWKRQQFHLPCGKLRLEKMSFQSFLAQYQANDAKSIFWLDYNGLEYWHFESFMTLLGNIAADSMIKVTLRADPTDYIGKPNEFRKRFEAIMPDPSADPPGRLRDYVYLLQEMMQIAAQRALPAATPLMFQPVSSFFYSDGTGMFTLTGIVCLRKELAKIKGLFQGWKFANVSWARPKRIDVPILSTKERLHLQNKLPCTSNGGKILRRALGYLIDESWEITEGKLQQYADFHRYSPYFMKAIP